jgi:hypothetical protein
MIEAVYASARCRPFMRIRIADLTYLLRYTTATALLLGGLASPAFAQTDRAAADGAAQSVPPQRPPVLGPTPPPKPNLRERTRQFEPTRFNLSGRGGQGLIEVVSPYTLAPWEIGSNVGVSNFDRNPGDVDFFAYTFQAAIGLPGRVELFVSATPVLRTNSVNQDPTGYPVPPLDLFVDVYPTAALRDQPYFLYAQEVPYKSYFVNGVRIDPPGHGAFGSSSGDITVGGKVNLLSEERGNRLGFGVRGYLEIPTEHPSYNTEDWRRVAGVSGKVDIGADLLFAKQLGPAHLLANVGYEHVGDPQSGLRVQYIDSSRWDTIDPATGLSANFLVGQPVETKLDLRDQLATTVGTALPAFNVNGMQFWLLSELSYTRYIGGATRVERLVHPVEMRLGIQANVPKYPSISVGAAWQLLFNDAGDGTMRQSTFVSPDGRGDLNFGLNVAPDLAPAFEQWFAERGAAFRENSSRMLSTNNPRFDQWRNVTAGPTPVVAMGGGNILAFVTWRVH